MYDVEALMKAIEERKANMKIEQEEINKLEQSLDNNALKEDVGFVDCGITNLRFLSQEHIDIHDDCYQVSVSFMALTPNGYFFFRLVEVWQGDNVSAGLNFPWVFTQDEWSIVLEAMREFSTTLDENDDVVHRINYALSCF